MAVVLQAKEFLVNQALLTGETFPAEKRPGPVPLDAGLSERHNCVFMGSSVRSGTGTALIVRTGKSTVLGEISQALIQQSPETEFERGLRHFGGLLLRIMIVTVLAVLSINIILQRPTIDTLLFAIALAVGLSPELLPAILTITLSRGAQNMARQGVIVRHLNAIENLGSMDILCTDKTGTLTRGVVQLDATLDTSGASNVRILHLATLNASLQTGLSNPLDEAIVARARSEGIDCSSITKLDEIPYDFSRKRLGVVVEAETPDDAMLIVKGALTQVLDVCSQIRRGDTVALLDESDMDAIQKRFSELSQQGFRVLGLATRVIPRQPVYTRDDEQQMTFEGFLLFFDPPEPQARRTLQALHALEVELKIITGDNHLVARHIAETVGLSTGRVLTGGEMLDLTDEALWQLAPEVSVFAEVDPAQKERVIRALQKTGHAVGYLGDGINDAPALHAADVGISVNTAVDVAKEAADLVLLEHELDAVRLGIEEGRRTFANTLKYVFITTSANFGNMVSMAAASLFLPFLPLLAKQVLLNNFLSEIPAMGIAADRVDPDWRRSPHRWNMRFVRDVMLTFGLVSVLFDLLTFSVLLYFLGGNADLFRTGWFLESLLTELLILFVIRTAGPFHRSRPGRLLLWSTVVVLLIALALPYTGIGAVFSLHPLPAPMLGAILLISAVYMLVSEATKRAFYRRHAP